MALNFTGGANTALVFASTGFTDFPYGTSAAVIWLTSGVPANGAVSVVFMGANSNTDDNDIINIYGTAAGFVNSPGCWNSTAANDSNSVSGGVTLNHWTLVAVSKATGSNTPRCHIFDFTTGVWTHVNGNVALVDAAATGQQAYALGGTANGVFGGMIGDIAATAAWYKRVLSDGEVERLAAGNWTRYSPDTLCEFRSGRTLLGAGPLDHGRERMPTSIFGSAITRSVRVDPPGFRFSPMGRRR